VSNEPGDKKIDKHGFIHCIYRYVYYYNDEQNDKSDFYSYKPRNVWEGDSVAPHWTGTPSPWYISMSNQQKEVNTSRST